MIAHGTDFVRRLGQQNIRIYNLTGRALEARMVREVEGEDAVVILPMAYVTLTIDHRVVDGHQTNAWLTRFVQIVENWPAG